MSGPICWHCYTGEWSLYVGIATVLVVLVYGDIAILVSCAYMLVLLHWRMFLDVGIAILVSGPYMLGLLHW